jgi:hypothetical protein
MILEQVNERVNEKMEQLITERYFVVSRRQTIGNHPGQSGTGSGKATGRQNY